MDRQLRRVQGAAQLITPARTATDVPSGHGPLRSIPACRRRGMASAALEKAPRLQWQELSPA